MAVTDIVDLASKIDSESKYWQGYDPDLIAKLKTASSNLEYDYNRMSKDASGHRQRLWHNTIITFLIIAGIIGFTITIGFFTTRAQNIEDKIRREKIHSITDSDLEELGFRKYESSYEIILVKRKQ